MNILFVNACLRSKEQSRTYRIANVFLKELQENPLVSISEVDLQNEELLPLKGETLEKRDNAALRGDFSDSSFDLAKQFAAADRIVIAAPLWDLNFPALLKIYLENICVGGITFQYTDGGGEGLCRADRLMYITTRGGDFSLPSMLEMEQAIPYLKALCTMLGIERVEVIGADGLDIIENDVESIVIQAEKEAVEKAAAFLS